MRVAVDTNVLAYAEGINGRARQEAARDLLRKLPPEDTLLPVQALSELFNVLVRKARRAPVDARTAVLSWGDNYPLIEASASVALAAVELSAHQQMSIWDAMILAAAADVGCRLLLSEDFQDGFTWSGVTVTNPFTPDRHALLNALLS